MNWLNKKTCPSFLSTNERYTRKLLKPTPRKKWLFIIVKVCAMRSFLSVKDGCMAMSINLFQKFVKINRLKPTTVRPSNANLSHMLFKVIPKINNERTSKINTILLKDMLMPMTPMRQVM